MAWNETWEQIFKSQEWGKYPSEDLIRFVARNFYNNSNRKEIKILEVGCGTGANLWFVAREGFSVYGIDGSTTAIKKTGERLDAEVPGWTGELLIGDIVALPFEDNQFDAVIDNEAISTNEYMDSIKMYNEIYRVLKPNGKFYNRTFAKGSWGDGTGQKIDSNTWVPDEGPLSNKGITRFSTKENINEFLQKFDILELETLEKTYNNMSEKVIEWIIVAQKK